MSIQVAFRISIAAASLALLAAGCGGKWIDLVPVLSSGTGTEVSARCHVDSEGKLVISIRNNGKRIAFASSTLIQFEGRAPVVLPTRPVPPLGEETVRFRLPDKCLTGGCRFSITVDGRDDVGESDESNNTVTGSCPSGGPVIP